ncbi:hypothetical protein NUU61_001997 [Penicillium alfredii]|uniref:HDA1 complex subunit n=1 Tax=Penicillium alfredii TaxID=1506179 RepID=A0A9W9FQR8_9EURO|nr:uncharacterized protein NUU61_001997 [Penicillium alfredii]KAJ5104650.1 hypothetical protein NUU61_001997 [Penicillium alfredii]
MADQGRKPTSPTSENPMDRYGHLSGSTPREKVQNIWAEVIAKPVSEVSQAASAAETPSSVGDIEASAPISIPETTAPLSVRADTDSVSHSHTAIHHAHAEPLLPPSDLAHGGHTGQSTMQTIQPSALTVINVEETAPGSVRLGPSEFAVTLPMDSRVKDYYERVLADAATDIREFIESFSSTEQMPDRERDRLQSSMNELVAQLNNVSTHPDLNISDHLKGAKPDLQRESSWAEYSSAKFLLLGHLVEITSTQDFHLVLAVQDEKRQRVLERYLQGKGFSYTRPREEMGSTLEVSLAKGSLSFGIHSNDSVRELFKPPSAIFALDTSFNPKSPSVQHIRTTYARNGGLLPVIWLLIANTSEHIERCLPDIPEPDRLRLLVRYTARLHEDVGDLQDDALGVHENAEEILGYLSDSFASWPLPPIEPLPFVSIEESDSSGSSSDESMPTNQKRPLEEEEGEGEEGSDDFTSKRARLDTQGTSQLTQSTKLPSQTLGRDLHSLEKSLIEMQSAHADEKEQLQKDLTEMSGRWRELDQEIGIIQHRYETRTNDFHKTRQERDLLLENKATLEQRVEKQKEDNSKIKEERRQLKGELEEARQALKDGGGSMAELETAREEIRRLTKENAGLERKSDYERKQAEYTREQYQNASTAAAQLGTEARQLRAENETLNRKVEANAVRLREMNTQNDAAIHLARIGELELIVTGRDDLLRKKEDELREIRKNRPSTRSTSTQPRSPKWAASSRPTSPGVSNNGNGNGSNGLAGRGSALRFSSEMPF